jgi:hypothetical protein
MTDTGAQDTGGEEQPRGKRYDERIEEWVRGLQEGAEERAPEVLSGLAATAKDVARFLEDKAEQARRRRGGGTDPEPTEPGSAIEQPPTDDPA